MVLHSPQNMNGLQTNAQPFNKLCILILIGFLIEARLVLTELTSMILVYFRTPLALNLSSRTGLAHFAHLLQTLILQMNYDPN